MQIVQRTHDKVQEFTHSCFVQAPYIAYRCIFGNAYADSLDASKVLMDEIIEQHNITPDNASSVLVHNYANKRWIRVE